MLFCILRSVNLVPVALLLLLPLSLPLPLSLASMQQHNFRYQISGLLTSDIQTIGTVLQFKSRIHPFLYPTSTFSLGPTMLLLDIFFFVSISSP